MHTEASSSLRQGQLASSLRLAVTALCAGLLASCGGSNNTADDATDPEASSTDDDDSDEAQGMPEVRFVGRVDATDAAGPKFSWSGTGVIARFSGTSVAVRLDGGQLYTVVVDGAVGDTLVPTGDADILAEGLAPGDHQVELYRRTEGSQGESVFLGFEFADGELLPPPPAPDRRIEIIGDSITCGYGNEGADMNCGFTPETENHYMSYGAIAARALGAELMTVAYSGKGVVCNYGDDDNSCVNPMPTYYDRTLPNRGVVWDFESWQADAVVINLGTNDFSTSLDPTREEFEIAYTALLERVREAYPDASILCTVGPMLTGADLDAARSSITGAVEARNAAGDEKVTTFELTPQDGSNGYGCDWHPSIATHQAMADVLTGVLRTELGWTG